MLLEAELRPRRETWSDSRRFHSDFQAVSETPLEKVLRLAFGTTHSYVRFQNGRQVNVHDYPTPKPNVFGRPAVPNPAAAPKAAPVLQHGQSTFGELRKGQVVEIGGQRYMVTHDSLPSTQLGTGPGPGGQGGFSGPQAQSNAAFFRTPQQNPAAFLLRNKGIPKGTPVSTIVLSNMTNHWSWHVTLPASMALPVVG